MNSQKEFYLLLLSFILPIVFGSIFFYTNPGYFTQTTVNYGTLIQPIITTNEENFKFEATIREKKWQLAYIVDENCNQDCQDTLHTMRIIRTLLNDEMQRMQLAALTTPENSLVKHPKFITVTINQELNNALQNTGTNKIFLIDPIGNIMLHYDADTIVVKQVLKDLKRLFKYSRIG